MVDKDKDSEKNYVNYRFDSSLYSSHWYDFPNSSVDWYDFPTSPIITSKVLDIAKTKEKPDNNFISVASEALTSDDFKPLEKAQIARDIMVSLKENVSTDPVLDAYDAVEAAKGRNRAAYVDDKSFWHTAIWFVGVGILAIVIVSAILSFLGNAVPEFFSTSIGALIGVFASLFASQAKTS